MIRAMGGIGVAVSVGEGVKVGDGVTTGVGTAAKRDRVGFSGVVSWAV
jgi:hypothetical protein